MAAVFVSLYVKALLAAILKFAIKYLVFAEFAFKRTIKKSIFGRWTEAYTVKKLLMMSERSYMSSVVIRSPYGGLVIMIALSRGFSNS